MVLRRCHLIVVSDASQDPDFGFQDLGAAVRKIRVDFGIPITFDKGIPIYPRKLARTGHYCALGRIGYSYVDGPDTDGVLVYIKPTVYGTEPMDVCQYSQENKAFPHDTTADQWFDESQFESYRMLGSYIADLVCGRNRANQVEEALSLDTFVERIRDYLNRPGKVPT